MRSDRAKAHFPEQGRLAQLVEHLVYTERVGGSSPSAPTTGFIQFGEISGWYPLVRSHDG
jgi:hypothetical protein